jgi:tubulin--tyrosine ligase
MTQVRRLAIIKDLLPHQIYNHIDGINQLAMKCQLHKNMEEYGRRHGFKPFDIMPETYIIELQSKMNSKYILDHAEFQKFQKAFTKGSWWILKPGEDANRGHGIKVLDNLQKIQEFITFSFNSGPKRYRTCIIQRYIQKPLLVYRRKFDIRVFALATYQPNFEKSEGTLRGWFYEEGYIRTSCKEYNLQAGNDNQYMHLTNDAVQKQSSDYGKYEAGNKISYSDFDKLLLKENQTSFFNKILPQIKQRVAETFQAAGKRLVGEVRSDYNGFEWLGFDFMLDEDMKLLLIEVNTNPCLETASCILLQRLIPQMLDQSLKIAVDPFFGASEQQYLMNHEFVATEIKYAMVYEEVIENIKQTPSYEMDELYYYQSQNCEKADIEQNLKAAEEQEGEEELQEDNPDHEEGQEENEEESHTIEEGC